MSHEIRVSSSQKDGEEFDGELRSIGRIYLVGFTAILSVMAYLRVSSQWLIVVSFVAITLVMVECLRTISKQFETRLSYISQTATAADERLTAMRLDSILRA